MPVLVIAEAKTVWMNFLAQYLLRSLESGISGLHYKTETQMFLLLFFLLLRLLLSSQSAAKLRRCFTRSLTSLLLRFLFAARIFRRSGGFRFRRGSLGARRCRSAATTCPLTHGWFSPGSFAISLSC